VDRPFPAYKGDEPYVFVSYSHRDSSAVFPEIIRLRDQGFNIWFDEGIEAGTEWREELAKAIEGAKLLIYFVTGDSVLSDNCRKEVNFAVDEDIPIVAVHLEAVELPSGLKLTLSDRQAILKHEISNDEYQQKLQSRISTYLDLEIVPTAQNAGSKSTPVKIVVIAVAVVSILMVGLFFYDQQDVQNEPDYAIELDGDATPLSVDQKATDKPSDRFDPAAKLSIAVLPFVNMSSDKEQEYFSDGITEEILNSLGQVKELKVAGRTSSFAFKGQNVDLREIGNTLGVEHILEGSVRKSGTTIRITAQLNQVKDGFHLWSATYDRELTDVFAIQDEIASEILSELKLQFDLKRLDHVAGTTNVEAYEAYLRGRQEIRKRTKASLETALGQLQIATAKDPNYALAWAAQGLATDLLGTNHYGSLLQDEATVRSRALLERALFLDPDLPEAHAALAGLYRNEYQHREAFASLNRALASNPSYAVALIWRADVLQAMGRNREADRDVEKAYELDPLHPVIRSRRMYTSCVRNIAALSEQDFKEMRNNTRTFCLTRHGEYAQAILLQSGSRRFPATFIKECDDYDTAVVRGYRGLSTLFICANDQDALRLYEELTPAERAEPPALESLHVIYMRQGRWQEAINALDKVHGGRVPVYSSVPLNNRTSNTSLALNLVFAYRKLNRIQEADELLTRVRDLVNVFKAQQRPDQYYLLEAKLLLLEGDEDQALKLIDQAFREFEVIWSHRHDPVLEAMVGKERIREMTGWLEEHIDQERAKLGMAPAEF